ncbi:MAG: hypothetical protein RJA07_43 [Bacteroidota bacterium]|jgi:cytosine/adenosine deaminase-related metal-dependent hydrolase
MRKFSADKIYTIENGIIENGVLVIDKNNTIVEIGERQNYDIAELEIYNGDICPGFVNAHCHIELSHLKNKITPHTGLVNFIEQLMKVRFEMADDERCQAIEDAENEMIKNGIVAVGDISNETISIKQKAKQKLFYHTFIETVGLNPSIAEKRYTEAIDLSNQFAEQKLTTTMAPHAPYSTSIELMKRIFNKCETSTIHNQETEDEANFFIHKSGNFLSFYKNLNLDISFFNATAINSLQSIIQHLPTQQNMLFVHNTFADKHDLKSIKQQNPNAYLCACAKANLFIENALPNYNLWFTNFKNICIGTDSLASNYSLSIWDEIKTIQHHFADIPFETILQCATLNGAKFLNIDDWAGSIALGKRPGINIIENGSCTKLI